MFVTVTLYDQRKSTPPIRVDVNVQHVAWIEPRYHGGVILHFGNGGLLEIVESRDEFLARAANRS